MRRTRIELTVAASIVAVLLALGVALGSAMRPTDDPDQRPSSFLSSRGGVKGAADALQRMGVRVERVRSRAGAMERYLERGNTTLAVIAPSRVEPTPDEYRALLSFNTDSLRGSLFLAGSELAPLMRCFGYSIDQQFLDSLRATPRGVTVGDDAPWVHARLVADTVPPRAPRTRRRLVVDEGFDCARVPIVRVDTLVEDTKGAPVLARLTRADSGGAVILLADASLLSNRVLRASSTAPAVLDALIDGNRRVAFDEFHHGFAAGGSMARVALAWSVRHPVGWATWQLVAVGLLALLAAGVRFGPIRPGIRRERRSPLEHVRALATALAAARGHEVAVAAIVRGLRRRLAPATQPAVERPGDEWRAWLDSLVTHAPSPRARASAERLRRAVDDPQPDAAVLTAANAVEDLWKDLRP